MRPTNPNCCCFIFFLSTTQVLQSKERTDTQPKTDATELPHQLLCNKKTAKNFHPVVQVNKMVHCPKIGGENAASFKPIQMGFPQKTRKYSGEKGLHIIHQAADLEPES